MQQWHHATMPPQWRATMTQLFLRQGWRGDDRHRMIFRSIPTLAGGMDRNENEIRVGFAGICDKERGIVIKGAI